MSLKKKYIGSREFYGYVIKLVLPMILQNVITNLVSMLDNIMIGRVGTLQMDGVSIANQFIFIFNLSIFGALSGPGIFGAQFYGKGDHEGQKYTFRFRLIVSVLLLAVGIAIFTIFEEPLINLYINAEDTPQEALETLGYGVTYLRIMRFGLIPFAIGQAYSSVVRECGETKVPMYASLAAIGVNLVLDYGLIFGRLGLPEMGVAGAALATVVAKVIAVFIVIVWAHRHKERNRYIIGLFRGFKIPLDLTGKMIVKGFPLLMNEFLWSSGMSIIAQAYSLRGLDVVAARNIAGTLTNLYNVFFIQMGACTAIILGQELGAGKLLKAKEDSNKLLFFSVAMSAVLGLLMLPVAKYFPMIYNTSDEIKSLATSLLLLQAFAMPIWAYTNSSYFIIRSGGRTGITFLFDFVFTWVVMIPLAVCLSRFTDMEFKQIFMIVTYSEFFKCIIGYFMVHSNMWVRNIVGTGGSDTLKC